MESDETPKQKIKIEIKTVIEAGEKTEVDKERNTEIQIQRKRQEKKKNTENGKIYIISTVIKGVHCFKYTTRLR